MPVTFAVCCNTPSRTLIPTPRQRTYGVGARRLPPSTQQLLPIHPMPPLPTTATLFVYPGLFTHLYYHPIAFPTIRLMGSLRLAPTPHLVVLV